MKYYFHFKTCIICIKTKKGLDASCGFQKSSGTLKAKREIQNLVDFFDFHKYDDSGELPKHYSLGLPKPYIIGECGQKTSTWDDSLQITVVKKFLENFKKNRVCRMLFVVVWIRRF